MSSTVIITSENVQQFISNVSSKFNISYDELMNMWNEQQTSNVIQPAVEVVNESTDVPEVSSGKCSGKTKKGTQCTKNAVSNGRCNLHKLEVPVVEQTVQSEVAKVQEVSSGKCTGKTKKGTQCTKNAISNGRCNLHKLEVQETLTEQIANNVVETVPDENNVPSNEFVVNNDMNPTSEPTQDVTPVVTLVTNTTSEQQENVSATEQVTSSIETTVTISKDDICTSVTKKGKKCTKKSVSNGKCKTHQKVNDEVEEEPKRELPTKLGPLIVHYRLGLIWDQKVTRFVFLKENGKCVVIGRYSTKLNYLTEEDISLIKSLNLTYKNVDFLTLEPQFPEKIEIQGEYQRIGEEVGWNDQEFDNIISAIIIESLEKGECDVDSHVDKLLQRYKYTFFMYEANELRKLSQRLVRYHSQYTDLYSYMVLHKHEILNHIDITNNFTNVFVKKITKILDEHSKYIKSCNLSRYIKCIENMIPTYVPECLEFAPCKMLDKYILSIAVKVSSIQNIVYAEPTVEHVSESIPEQRVEVVEEQSEDIHSTEAYSTLPESASIDQAECEASTVTEETEISQTEDKSKRNVKNIVKSVKSFPKKKKQFKDHVEALREITEPILEDPDILTQ